ncbi:hypothetical protein EXIGLDRAFT_653432 [Exidia glandulosa HHB12029]|uniref:Uncharacterized protein n=1 Tax=Exidia glandulosa HHB12029 TaxID=1314781 RepID=A0A165ZWD4_EXIGL|nr:hypothetical protein EXIGLDRAFT_653432 [Exidia glandulosa HHB12029]
MFKQTRGDFVEGPEEPQYVRGGQNRPMINTAAPFDVRSLLVALENTEGDPAEIAEDCVETQLKSWAKTLEQTRNADTSLGKPLGVDLDNLEGITVLGTSPQSDAATIAKAATACGVTDTKTLWTWERLPYAVRCAGLALADKDTTEDERPKKKTRSIDDEKFVADADEWILRNETYLRLLSRASRFANEGKPWTFGLLRLEDLRVAIPGSEDFTPERADKSVAITIPRAQVESVPGFRVLEAKRADAVFVQPSIETFRERWASMTEDCLDGLDWTNVCVAGGLVLGALLTPDAPMANKPKEWVSSDIDLYVYGLESDVDAANRKIKHIAETYKSNLPPGAPFLAVRNSQTITLYSRYPLRRVQIVLKLVSSPREVLLNFDLDVVAAAFDGEQVWMLPRFVRAIETGTNVFTMDLITGHHLGDRKATRDKRVFKYANKGYGIRILPSYVAALSTYNTRQKIAPHTRGERLYLDLDLNRRLDDARNWTIRCIRDYLKVGHSKSPFHWPKPFPPVKSKVPVFSHAMLEGYGQTTSEPLGRSCLTGFTLFMRHVALWEEEVAGRIKIFEDLYATDTYGDGPNQELSYDDSPAYTWDSEFTIKDFKRSMDEYNKKEMVHTRDRLVDPMGREERDRFFKLKVTFPAARITYADSIEELLSREKDLQIPLIVPGPFFHFANKVTLDGLQRAHPPSKDRSNGPLSEFYRADPDEDDDDEDGDEDMNDGSEKEIYGGTAFATWRLDCVLNWQMLDRSIDEVRETLWAFHRAAERSNMVEEEHSIQIFKTHLSRRVIRTSTEDEMEAFVRWVGRKPFHDETKLNAAFKMWEMGGSKSSGEESED